MRDIISDINLISEIVSFPQVIAEIQSEATKENVASVRIAQLIETDAALTIQVLRAINSPFYGLRWEVTSVPQAVAFLGFEEVSHLALLYHMRQEFNQFNDQQVDYLNDLWKHSLATAILSQSLASKLAQRPLSKAFTAGILHDIGKIVFVQCYPIYHDEVRNLLNTSDIADVEAEEQLIGISHATIGGHLCERWKLPAELRDIIQHHHKPAASKYSPVLTAIVRFADVLAEIWEHGINELPKNFSLADHPSWHILQKEIPSFQTTPLDNVCLELKKELERRIELFNIG